MKSLSATLNICHNKDGTVSVTGVRAGRSWVAIKGSNEAEAIGLWVLNCWSCTANTCTITLGTEEHPLQQ